MSKLSTERPTKNIDWNIVNDLSLSNQKLNQRSFYKNHDKKLNPRLHAKNTRKLSQKYQKIELKIICMSRYQSIKNKLGMLSLAHFLISFHKYWYNYMSKILLDMIRNIVNHLSLSNHKLNQR